MLLQFAVENFRSFRDRVELNMRASPSVRHPGRSAELSADLRVLRGAAIYGANASGKSNLIKALGLARELVIAGPASKDSALPVEPFRLAAAAADRPATFEFYVCAGDALFGYSFALTSSRVVHERLCLVDRTSLAEEPLFVRGDKFEFFAAARGSSDEPGFLDYVARGTRPNQLFLHEAHERGVAFTAPLRRWFAETLTIIGPDSRFVSLEDLADKSESFRARLESMLAWADVGIVGVQTERHSLDERTRERVDQLLKDPARREFLLRMVPRGRGTAVVRGDEGELEAVRIETRHRGAESPVSFDLVDESDGTLRLMDLAPMLHFAEERNDVVFVVDELDRSLHTLLAQDLVRKFLAVEPATGAATTQLIFTTHDTNLLDCELLGHDCVWFTEKEPKTGASSLYSLAEFPEEQLAALGAGIERGYLQGRFGAIPFLGDPRRLRLHGEGS